MGGGEGWCGRRRASTPLPARRGRSEVGLAESGRAAASSDPARRITPRHRRRPTCPASNFFRRYDCLPSHLQDAVSVHCTLAVP